MEMLTDWWYTTGVPFRVLFVTTLAATVVQLAMDLIFTVRVVLWKPKQTEGAASPTFGVSVVICARNEERNLRDLIPALMEQRHPDFEVVVVDDSSWDGTSETLRAYAAMYPRLKVIRLDEDRQRMTGKKFALTVGIKGAKNDIVLLTDADCMPASRNWISSMSAAFSEPHVEVVLGVSPYRRMAGLLNRVVRYDAAQVAVNYLSLALAGLPYMGVGRNLAYRKELFFRIGGFKSHLHIASGDDDLFIAEVASRKNTVVVMHPDAHTLSKPKATWASWMHQKRRHFTTAPMYRFGVKLLLGLWPLSYFVMLSGVAVLMLVHNAFLIAAAFLLLRYAVHLATFIGAFRKTGQTDLIAGAPLWEFIVWTITPALWIWNLLAAPRTWK